MSEFNYLQVSTDGAIATVTLNRPRVHNAIDDAMRVELIDALAEIDADDRVRGVILTGAGKSFCAGGDISGMQERLQAAPEQVAGNGWRRQKRTHRSIQLLHGMSKPTIAAVNGAASGLGCDLALACDFIVAAKSAMFSMSFVNRGLVPDGGGMYFLPRRVGLARAKDMIFSGRKVLSEEALAIGLADKVAPDDTLLQVAGAWALELTKASPLALALIKPILDKSLESEDEHILSLGRQAQAICYTSAEHRASVEAFLANRNQTKSG
jgi:2-(1,2-epoxy-1,2-dihydrophenyl)acetyl-CoA isomerase